LVDLFLERRGVRIVRIVSTGQVTPDGQWYDQETDDWVLVVEGAARLRIEGEETDRELNEGFFLASAWSVSLTRVPTCPLGSQKRAKAQRLSASVSDMVGPAMTLACSLLFSLPGAAWLAIVLPRSRGYAAILHSVQI
jgi:5-keto 4-deoxyuronate isomerase